MVQKYPYGFLILVILVSSIYIVLPDEVRIDVKNTKTLISVYEDDKWTLGATEFLNLFDGTKKMRAKSREVTNKTNGNYIILTRTSKWKDNITTVHDYIFDSTVSDVALIPIEENLYCYNCLGKIVHFEYRNILYTGITRPAISPESFGHNIRVEWEPGYEWAKVYQQKVASDKLVIRYEPKSNYEVYSVRLFDPPVGHQEVGIDILNLTSEVVRDGLGQIVIPSELPNTKDKDNPFDINMSGNVLLLHFEENTGDTTFIDSSGEGNDGTCIDCPVSNSTGKIGGAFKFDGQNDFIEIPYDDSINVSNNLTIGMWLNADNAASNKRIFRKSKDEDIQFQYQSGSVVRVRYENRSNNAATVACTTSALNRWQFVVFTYDSTGARIYCDGVLEETDSYINELEMHNVAWTIGRGDSSARWFNGTIDELSIWNRSMNIEDVQLLYQRGLNNLFAQTQHAKPVYSVVTNQSATCALYMSDDVGHIADNDTVFLSHFQQNQTDESQYGNTGTLVNDIKKIEGGIFLNGSNGNIGDYISFPGFTHFPTLDNSEPFTLGIKFKLMVHPHTQTQNIPLIAQAKDTSVFLGIENDGGDADKIRFKMDDGQSVYSTHTINEDEVYYVIATFNGLDSPGSGILYLDGVENNTGNAFDAFAFDNALYIGYEDRRHGNFTGEIYEAWIMARNITAGEALNISTNGITPDMNFSKTIELDGERECETTGASNHICGENGPDVISPGLSSGFVSCKDASGNEGLTSTSGLFLINMTDTLIFINLDGIDDTRKYEFLSFPNISANCTSVVGNNCSVSIDIIAPFYGFNLTTGINETSILFNITHLRIVNFTEDGIEGSSIQTLQNSGTVNFTSDNRTQILNVSINVSSTGTITNLTIRYYGIVKSFIGSIKGNIWSQSKFIESSILKDAVNITYSVKGSKSIFSNLTDIDNPLDMSLRISGFSLDDDNEFIYLEDFNGTDGSVGFNQTLSSHADAPLGVFDEFANNNTNWSIDIISSSCSSTAFDYQTSPVSLNTRLTDSNPTPCTANVDYDNPAADLRNTSLVSIYFDVIGTCPSGSGSWGLSIRATDGTSNVDLKNYGFAACPPILTAHYNLTLIKSGDKEYEVFQNGSSQGTTDISSLDFDKQIRLRAFVQSSGGAPGTGQIIYTQHLIEWGGGWLNRSTNNGTYKSIGNISSCVNRTTTPLIRATLTAIDYSPVGTNIDYFLTNDNGTTFEEVLNGVTHTFTSEGSTDSEVCWLAELSSTSNITSPVVRKITVSVVKASAENLTVEIVGSSTIITFDEVLNSTNGPFIVNLTPIPNILDEIKISSAVPGQIQVDQFNVNATINPIVLSNQSFEDCTLCFINFTFTDGPTIVSDLIVDFLGSLNYTVTARFDVGAISVSKIIQVFYSYFNITLPGTEFYDVFPTSKDSKNVSPFGQKDDIPIWNLSNLAYDRPIDVYVKTNLTPDRINITYTNSSNQSNPADTIFILNETYVKILDNVSIDTGSNIFYKGIWNYINLFNVSNRFELAYVYFTTICSDCVFDERYLDNFFTIIE